MGTIYKVPEPVRYRYYQVKLTTVTSAWLILMSKRPTVMFHGKDTSTCLPVGSLLLSILVKFSLTVANIVLYQICTLTAPTAKKFYVLNETRTDLAGICMLQVRRYPKTMFSAWCSSNCSTCTKATRAPTCKVIPPLLAFVCVLVNTRLSGWLVSIVRQHANCQTFERFDKINLSSLCFEHM